MPLCVRVIFLFMPLLSWIFRGRELIGSWCASRVLVCLLCRTRLLELDDNTQLRLLPWGHHSCSGLSTRDPDSRWIRWQCEQYDGFYPYTKRLEGMADCSALSKCQDCMKSNVNEQQSVEWAQTLTTISSARAFNRSCWSAEIMAWMQSSISPSRILFKS